MPCGILPKLSSVRHLELIWPRGDIEVLEKGELGALKNLEIFKVQFRDWSEYEAFAKSLVRPKRYYAILEDYIDPKDFSVEAPKGIFRVVEMGLCFPPREGSFVLPDDVQSISLTGNSFSGSLGELLSQNNVANLEHCKLFGTDGMNSLISSALIKEGLDDSLHVQPAETFSHLKCLDISCNSEIESLFEACLLVNLQNLEELIVYGCHGLKEIITDRDMNDAKSTCEHSSNNRDKYKISLPKLRRLQLDKLPKLESISRRVLVCDFLQVVLIDQCFKLKRLPLSLKSINGQLSPPSSLTCIRVSDRTLDDAKQWWESVEWDDPAAKEVLQPFVTLHSYTGW